MNTELIGEMGTDLRNFCDGQPCYECRYNLFGSNCRTAFTIDYLAEHGYLKERPEKATVAKTETVADNSSAPATLPEWCKPVKFRPYTYEEAKRLPGKVMEHTETIPPGDKRHVTSLINRVDYYENGGELYINLFGFDWWAAKNATIDGVPIGVPEVDEDAMKGGAE